MPNILCHSIQWWTLSMWISKYSNILLYSIIIIIIIKTSSTDPSGKNKIVYKLLTQPHKHLRHGKTEKQTQESSQRLTALLNPSNVSESNTV